MLPLQSSSIPLQTSVAGTHTALTSPSPPPSPTSKCSRPHAHAKHARTTTKRCTPPMIVAYLRRRGRWSRHPYLLTGLDRLIDMTDPTSFEGKAALVIGGSSGVGKATVQALAARGARVTAVARDAAKLGALASTATISGDATD